MTALWLVLFWLSAGAIVYTHAGYALLLWLLGEAGLGAGAPSDEPRRPVSAPPGPEADGLPRVALIVAAYDEQEVIAAKVANALEQEYPRQLLQVIVASDGSADRTAERAREAGADLVLELERGGKVAAQNAGAEAAREAGAEILAFSDANSSWEPVALRRLVAAFEDGGIGYACGQVRFVGPDGGNLEGAYWRYEMEVRRLESDLAGVTAGNGAIYAVRTEAYLPLEPSGSHDLSLPFALAKRGLRSVYLPRARASEKIVPSMEGELSRKRRMMVGLWDIVVGERMIDPRGYPPLYALEILSHRLIRYLTPFLHLIALAANLLLLGQGWFYWLALVLQVGLLAAAAAGRWLPVLPLRVARYYVMTTASIALGLWDRWRHGAPGTWEKAEGTR